MKKLLLIALILLTYSEEIVAQKYMARNGHIWFYSHTPIEDIEAHNRQVTSIIDLGSGDMAFSMLMKGFQFEKALMQEHFNEKYVESDKHPKASFKGKIDNLSAINTAEPGVYDVNVSGTLTMHGVSKEVQTTAKITIEDGGLKGTAKFPITVKDYDIKIPKLVEENIAKIVDVNVDIAYKLYK